MSLEVRLTRGAPPHITVSGQTPGGALGGVEHGGDSETNESVQAVLKPDEAAVFQLRIPAVAWRPRSPTGASSRAASSCATGRSPGVTLPGLCPWPSCMPPTP